MYQLVLLIHIVIAIALVALVLLQRGKGASMGAAFGAGASGTVFGSVGSASILFKLTAILAAAFFATSLTLGHMAAKQYRSAQEIVIPIPTQQQQEPAIPLFDLDGSVAPNTNTGTD